MLTTRTVGRLSLLGVMMALQLGAAKCPGRSKSSTLSAGAVARRDSSDQVMFGMRGVLTHQGVSRGILLAEKALVRDEGTRLDLQRLNLTFFNDAGLKSSVLTATEGTYDVQRSCIEVRGGVLLVGEDGRQLQTGRLLYDIARNRLSSDSAFTLGAASTRSQPTVGGFESDPQMAKLTRRKDIRPPKKGEPIPAAPCTISARRSMA